MVSTNRPFHPTHQRNKDGLQAMVLAESDNQTLFRCVWKEKGSTQENTLVRPTAKFNETFRPN